MLGFASAFAVLKDPTTTELKLELMLTGQCLVLLDFASTFIGTHLDLISIAIVPELDFEQRHHRNPSKTGPSFTSAD